MTESGAVKGCAMAWNFLHGDSETSLKQGEGI